VLWIGSIVGIVIVAAAISLGTGIGEKAYRAIFEPSAHTQSPHITISQLPNYVVSRTQGFVARGSVSELGADTLWLFDHVSGFYYLDTQANIDPQHHAWSAADRHLGSPGQRFPFQIKALVVLASPQCTSDLQKDFNSGRTQMPNLPSGCKAIGPAIRVTVDREHG
jgi:hypothetical protein